VYISLVSPFSVIVEMFVEFLQVGSKVLCFPQRALVDHVLAQGKQNSLGRHVAELFQAVSGIGRDFMATSWFCAQGNLWDEIKYY
jgi:hypothetical protein